MQRIKLFVGMLVALALIGAGLSVAKTVYAIHGTGTIQVTTDDTNAMLAVSRTNSQAARIGTDNASARLKPGTYLVSATDSGSSVAESVVVTKGRISSVTLDITGQLKKDSTYNSLISKLPYLGPAFTYKINYVMKYSNGQSLPSLTITSPNQTTKQSALNWITSQGVNPSDFDIKYVKGNLVPSSYNSYVGGN